MNLVNKISSTQYHCSHITRINYTIDSIYSVPGIGVRQISLDVLRAVHIALLTPSPLKCEQPMLSEKSYKKSGKRQNGLLSTILNTSGCRNKVRSIIIYDYTHIFNIETYACI